MSNALAATPIRSKTLRPNAFPGSFTRTPRQSRLLLVEPEFELPANRALLLTASSYSVTTVSSHNSVLKLHRDAGFSLAVLNDALGVPALRPVAICVRRTWHSARILILRRAESALDERFYDETIESPFHPKTLLDAPVKLADDPLDQKPRLFGTSPGAAWGSDAPLPSSPSKPPESDPTKAYPHDLDTEEKYSPDMPGGEQGDQRG